MPVSDPATAGRWEDVRAKALIGPLVALLVLTAGAGCRTGAGAPLLGVAEVDRWDKLVWVHVATGTWFQGVSKTEILLQGTEQDRPAPADYDGDGRAEIVVVRASRWVR